MQVSVLMSVYKNTVSKELIEAFDSVMRQTAPPAEIVLVIDGPVSDDLKRTIDELQNNIDILRVYPLEQNVGLGLALRAGVERCSYEMIARMDTDDICAPDRFELQLMLFENNPELSAAGSVIAEFMDDVTNITGYRVVPKTHKEICKYLKKRCPLNHMSVMFKKSEVLKAGNYRDFFYNEDSDLWVRMYLAGCKFENIQKVLVFARINKNTFMRRGGIKYYRSEKRLFKFMYKNKIIGLFTYTKAKAVRFILQVLMPNKLRAFIFRKFARKKKIATENVGELKN